jgi:hypothetical protein
VAEIARWFKKRWDESQIIKPDDMKRAKAAWNARQASRPPLNSFADYEIKTTSLPLICWYGSSDWDTNPKLTKGKTKEYVKSLEAHIEDGVEIEGPEDRRALQPGTWVLWFRRTEGDRLGSRAGLSWTRAGEVLEGAFSYTGEKNFRPVALSTKYSPGSEPFPVKDTRFLNSFREVLLRKEFKELRTKDYNGAWFTAARLGVMRIFWLALHAQYLS